jgi:hypothetical protein
MIVDSCDASVCSPRVASSFVYIERGASWLVSSALAAASITTLLNRSTLHFEGESLTIAVRGALRRLAAGESWSSGVLAVTDLEASTQRDARRAGLARVMLARSTRTGDGALTFVASQDASEDLRRQLFALTQVLTEEFPRATIRMRFVSPG